MVIGEVAAQKMQMRLAPGRDALMVVAVGAAEPHQADGLSGADHAGRQ